jgi:hypothetical protein
LKLCNNISKKRSIGKSLTCINIFKAPIQAKIITTMQHLWTRQVEKDATTADQGEESSAIIGVRNSPDSTENSESTEAVKEV